MIQKQLLAFFMLAYALTWSVFIGVGIPSPENPLVLLGVWGPSIAAILLTAVWGRGAGLKQLLGRLLIWRVGIQWYALILIGFPLTAVGAVIVSNWLTGGNVALQSFSIANLLPVLIFQFLIPGLGEEIGWRGYALPRMQKQVTPLAAAVVLALVHLFWHLPGFWMGMGFHNVPFWLGTLWIIPFTIIFVWVYNNTRGSLFVAALYHSFFGVVLSAVPILPSEQVIPITPELLTQFNIPAAVYPYTIFVLLTWLCALVVIWQTKGRLGYAQNEPEVYQAAAGQPATAAR